jgi:hypothetical protein
MANFHSIAIRSLGGLGILAASLAILPGPTANASQRSIASGVQRVASLADPAAQSGDAFGGSISVDGTTAIVGADGTDDSAGAAYIYVEGPSGWPASPTATLSDPSTGQNFFGSSVAIYGNYAIVGADAANGGAGAFYVYSLTGSVWSSTPVATVTGQSGTQQGLGLSVGIFESGDSAPEAIVGSKSSTKTNVYAGDVSGWSAGPTRYLSPEVPGDDGYSVGIFDDVAIVGAPLSNDAGFAYMYIAGKNGWSGEVKSIEMNSGGRGSTEFGYSVATTGTDVIVGATGEHKGHGEAYLYSSATSSNGPPLASFTVPKTDGFGASVGLSSGVAVIGTMASITYVFKKTRYGWGTQPVATLHDPAGSTGDMFGASVSATVKNSFVIGAPGTDDGSGAAYVYHA